MKEQVIWSKVKNKKVDGCFLFDCSFCVRLASAGILFRASRRVESGSVLSGSGMSCNGPGARKDEFK